MRHFRAFWIAAFLVVPAAWAQDAPDKATLKSEAILKPGQYLVSTTLDHFAVLQDDGNLCIYRGASPGYKKGSVWCSGQAPGYGEYFATVQRDGNLCVLRGTGPSDIRGNVWCSAKGHASTPMNFYAVLEGSTLSVWKPATPAKPPSQHSAAEPPKRVWTSSAP